MPFSIVVHPFLVSTHPNHLVNTSQLFLLHLVSLLEGHREIGGNGTNNERRRIPFQVDVVTWESHLWVQDVRSRDYGQYDCVARNEMGFDRAPVQLSGTSRPDAPVSLHVLNVTHEAVQLTWKPGFDGGLPQSYRIRYRQVLIHTLTFIIIDVEDVGTR